MVLIRNATRPQAILNKLVVSRARKWHRLSAGRNSIPNAAETTRRVRANRPQKGTKKQEPQQHAELLLRLSLDSNPESLCLVRATLQRAAEVAHFEESESRAIVRSVDEALANVIRHAYKGQGGLPIELTCRRLLCGPESKTTRGLEVVLSDSGEKADPKKLRGRPLDEIRPGGLGLHFMKQSMDVVEFRRKNGKNLLRMVKYLAPCKPEEMPKGE
jgi:anti-sigma regulatory factor (Ser/Thr protein kinase)